MFFYTAIKFLQKKNNYFLLLSLFYFNLAQAYSIALPRSLQGKPVYYEHSSQISGWSCGYNVLFNAASLEKKLKFKQKSADLNIFKSICSPYLARVGKDPNNASSNVILDELAKRLKLQPLTYLHFTENGTIRYLSPKDVKIYYPMGASAQHIAHLFEVERNKQHIEKMDYLRSQLFNQAQCAVIHFCCHVISRGSDHGILLSVVRDGLDMRLYVFDNTNANIEEHSQAKRYIDMLIKEFSITKAPTNRSKTNKKSADRNKAASQGSRNQTIQNMARGLGKVANFARWATFLD